MNDEQFTIHFEKIKQDIFRLGRLQEEIEQQKKALSTSDYELMDISNHSEPLHCEHILKNKACGRPIKHVYLVRERSTEKLFNVGSTCYVKMQTHREELSPNEQRKAIRTYESFQRSKEDFSSQRALLLVQLKEFIELPIQYLFDLADEYQLEIDKQTLLETMKSENLETISQLSRKIDDLWVEIHYLQSK
ncbi:hypothetical protein [Lactococcus lactis]|uniref:hypothetical protein n=1 Tax=Lactococcus lactis TaxID=1358 RepID=UPI003D1778DA